MAESSDGNAAQLASQQSTHHETALILSTQAGSDIAMTRLAFATADLDRKREELEQSIRKAKGLGEALEKNAAERQQLMAEVSGLTDNDYSNIDHTDPKVAALENKVAMLEAQVAQFQAKEREMANACAQTSERVSYAADDDEDDEDDDDYEDDENDEDADNDHDPGAMEHQAKELLATQQTLSFLLANYFGNDPVPNGALHIVQLMAAAKSPWDGDDDKLIEDLSLETYLWLKVWVDPVEY
ncbi:hypothetical protein B0I37DRAFT_411676 [Chaetomium sp. MPI-CAGE-AT-0009]|nr:hypothetical protein B0I37DRAFT_411676 [Chaetomium sp. MPI-CAGE-AT-0009]